MNGAAIAKIMKPIILFGTVIIAITKK